MAEQKRDYYEVSYFQSGIVSGHAGFAHERDDLATVHPVEVIGVVGAALHDGHRTPGCGGDDRGGHPEPLAVGVGDVLHRVGQKPFTDECCPVGAVAVMGVSVGCLGTPYLYQPLLDGGLSALPFMVEAQRLADAQRAEHYQCGHAACQQTVGVRSRFHAIPLFPVARHGVDVPSASDRCKIRYKYRFLP